MINPPQIWVTMRCDIIPRANGWNIPIWNRTLLWTLSHKIETLSVILNSLYLSFMFLLQRKRINYIYCYPLYDIFFSVGLGLELQTFKQNVSLEFNAIESKQTNSWYDEEKMSSFLFFLTQGHLLNSKSISSGCKTQNLTGLSIPHQRSCFFSFVLPAVQLQWSQKGQWAKITAWKTSSIYP